MPKFPRISLIVVLLCEVLFSHGAEQIDAGTQFQNNVFMVIAGMSSSQELCLSVENGRVDVEGADIILEPCVAAIAAGDGREQWKYQNGQLLNVAGGKCAGLEENSVIGGGHVVLLDCDDAAGQKDGRSAWELQGNGQMKLGRSGQYCLSQLGSGPGKENVAAGAAATATSSLDVTAHGAVAAVGGLPGSYWASELDIADPVEWIVDFGGSKKLSACEINWEFPAQSFTISLSTDGEHWSDVYSTDSNVLNSTYIRMDSVLATKAKVIMRKSHPLYGHAQGHALYGLASVAFYAPRLHTVVADCSETAKSTDARDKYFLSHVAEFDPSAAASILSELPAAEAAARSLAATCRELLVASPSCGASLRPALGATSLLSPSGAGNDLKARGSATGTQGAISRIHGMIGAAVGVNGKTYEALLRESRAAVLRARRALL